MQRVAWPFFRLVEGWLDDITDSMDMSLRRLLEIVKEREAWHVAFCGIINNQR